MQRIKSIAPVNKVGIFLIVFILEKVIKIISFVFTAII